MKVDQNPLSSDRFSQPDSTGVDGAGDVPQPGVSEGPNSELEASTDKLIETLVAYFADRRRGYRYPFTQIGRQFERLYPPTPAEFANKAFAEAVRPLLLTLRYPLMSEARENSSLFPVASRLVNIAGRYFRSLTTDDIEAVMLLLFNHLRVGEQKKRGLIDTP